MTMARMAHKARLGLPLPDGRQDVFWVQVYDAIYKRGMTLPVELIPLDFGAGGGTAAPEQRLALLDDIVTQELDVLIGWPFPESLAYTLLESGLAIVHLSETGVSHPLSVSPLGLGAAAEAVAGFVAEQLSGRGDVLVVGGLLHPGMPDDGRSRIAGVTRVFGRYPRVCFRHIPADWHPREARPQIEEALARQPHPFDAILGLSDTLAMRAREVAFDLGCCGDGVKLAGINGDPLAIAAILDGSMLATIETSSAHLGASAVEVACGIAYDQAYEPHFGYKTRLITAETATCVASEKLLAIDKLMNIPFELRASERLEHLSLLETSLNISRLLSTVLDEDELPTVLGSLIRDAYGFDYLRVVRWHEGADAFHVVELDVPGASLSSSAEAVEIYHDALAADRLVYVPDQQSSLRYESDTQLPGLRSRVVAPVRCGGATLGLLDLYTDRLVHCTRMHLLGVQALADQFGVATQNARFYRQLLVTGTPKTSRAPRPDAMPLPPRAAHAKRIRAGASAAETAVPLGPASDVTRRAMTYVSQHYSEPISRGDMSTALGVSENYLTDLFHREIGVSLWTYLNRFRIKQAKALLISTDAKITDIALRVGFSDPAYFSRVFRRHAGRSPRAYRESPQYVESFSE